MLAAMPPTPPTTPNQGEPLIRDRGDACPGALRLHPADDGRLARLRLPAGKLTARQVRCLALAADELGDGRISVTSRGNVELRGLGEDCGAALAGLLAPAGLLPSVTHERVRNIVASPLAGVDGNGCQDVQLWARELDALLCSRDWTTALSGRFLFALDDGRDDVGGLGADVTLFSTSGHSSALSAPPATSSRASGSGALLRVAGCRVFRVAAADAPRAALAAADAFLAAAREAGTGAWRVRELPEGVAPDLAAALDRAGVPAAPVGPDAPGAAGPDSGGAAPLPGVHAHPLTGKHAVAVAVPLGRLTSAQLRALAPDDGDDGELRLTPWRGAVVTGLADRAAAGARLDALAEAGLITRAGSPWLGVGACTGRPGCAKSLADVRADATPGHGAGGLPVHFSGCARRCGHPKGTWVDVVATGDGTYEVDGVPTPRTQLAAAVATARTPTTR
ncbi:precorrin-3B synthase [Streptomyces sp. NPDC053755]|uniref:precorrin-3B synthase n=1 Tax=Streptomyces sp. NPDC053755 TaxID=3155815 RepID=UPI00341E13F5